MNSDEIRKRFLDFFQARGHRIIPSSPLVPHGDPNLFFTSAGMVQFKPYFEGKAEPPARRMASIQKCFRKSDIDEVGDDTHLTFFEMLGNFSVGDYFKKEAIEWAWELLTDPKEQIALPKKDLWVSIYEDDEESYGYWRALDVPEDRIEKNGEGENYWFTSDVLGNYGPCGPCSEIHYDFGKTPGCKLCDSDECHPAISECGRFTELWNLVFTSYYQHRDGSRTDLPQKNIDTGAGLERWASVLQGERNVYDTDLFRPIIAKIEELSGRDYETAGKEMRRALRIVAEHCRAAAFLIADGVMPGNEGRGYVLRYIIRRACYYSLTLAASAPIGLGDELLPSREKIARGMDVAREGFERWQRSPFLPPVAEAAIDMYGSTYPQVGSARDLALHVVEIEEERFRRTVVRGLEVMSDAFDRAFEHDMVISGSDVFLLHDTYGFPKNLTAELGARFGFKVDEEGFEKAMEEQRERARAAGRFRLSEAESAEAYAALSHLQPRFTGYDTLSQQTSVAGIIAGGAAVESVESGDEAEIVLFETPFYAEQGGQVGDTGEIVGPGGRFRVEDTQKTERGLILHRGRVVEGRIAVNDDVMGQVDAGRRWDIMRNHTATHLLHAALRRVLGPHARQSGSLVAPERLRFDFTHVEALKPDELSAVERLVNEKIRENLPVRTERQSYEEATAGGATALFDEKYAAEVRVVEVIEDTERYSAELCGGTHVHATGDIGELVIVDEESVGAGLRRIEALTGRGAEEYVRERLLTMRQLRDRLGVTGDDRELTGRVEALFQEVDSLKKRVLALEREIGRGHAESLLAEAEHVDGRALLSARVPASSPEALREIGDWLRERLKSGVIVLGTVVEGRPSLLAMVTPDLAARGIKAGDLVKKAAEVTGGGGGGRPEMAQAGGRDASRLDEALRLAKELAADKMKGLRDS